MISMDSAPMLVLLLFVLGSTQGQQSLVFTHLPSYITIDSANDNIQLVDVQNVLCAMFGFTLHTELKFQGLLSTHSPFDVPKATLALTLFGGSDNVKQLKEHQLNLKVNSEYLPTRVLQHKLEHTYSKQSNVIEINHGSEVADLEGILEGLSDDHHIILKLVQDLLPGSQLLNATKPQLVDLLRQMGLILQSLTRVSQVDDSQWVIPGLGDLYSYELSVPVSDSDVMNKEVDALLAALQKRIGEVMRKLYGDEYVALVLSMPEADVGQIRKARSLLATDEVATDEVNKDLIDRVGISDEWTDDYPVIFHIVLWLVVFMAVLVIFVTYGMMSMDPGQDSIIYRMTSTRMKKE